MEELQQLRQLLARQRPADWNELPDLALYMDQIIAYMPRQLIHLQDGEGTPHSGDGLTSAMVNNYIKEGLVPRAEGKRYGRAHLAYLTAVCALKRVLSVKDIGALFSARAGEHGEQDGEEFYQEFCQSLDEAMTDAAQAVPDETEGEREELVALALDLALRSYAYQLACARILDTLAPSPSEKKEKKEKKAKK